MRTLLAANSRFKLVWATGIFVLAFFMMPKPGAAHDFTVIECKEGGDFIKNAALARDGGMSETVFIDKILDDIEVIKSFPRHLRWFVQDEEDANFLLSAATMVFQRPQSPQIHQSEFFKACLGRTRVAAKDFYRL